MHAFPTSIFEELQAFYLYKLISQGCAHDLRKCRLPHFYTDLLTHRWSAWSFLLIFLSFKSSIVPHLEVFPLIWDPIFWLPFRLLSWVITFTFICPSFFYLCPQFYFISFPYPCLYPFLSLSLSFCQSLVTFTQGAFTILAYHLSRESTISVPIFFYVSRGLLTI